MRVGATAIAAALVLAAGCGQDAAPAGPTAAAGTVPTPGSARTPGIAATEAPVTEPPTVATPASVDDVEVTVDALRPSRDAVGTLLAFDATVRNAGDRAVLVPLGATPAVAGAGADVLLSVPFAVQGGGEAPPQVEAVVLGPGQSRPLASESSVALPDGASQVRVCIEVLDAEVAPGGGEDGEELRFSAPGGPLPVTHACSAPSALTGAG